MTNTTTDTIKDVTSSGDSVSIDLQFAENGKLSNISVDGKIITGNNEQNQETLGPEQYTGNEPLDLLINTVMNFFNQFLEHIPVIGIALFAFIMTMLIATYGRRGLRSGSKRLGLKGSQGELIANFAFVILFCIALLLSLAIVFPELSLGKLFTYIGIASLVLGFAFRDILENYFAGMLLLWQFPFEVGDYVEIETDTGPVRGEVMAIYIRMTTIRKINNELVVVPNATMYKYPLSVETWAEARRQTLKILLAYDTDLEKAREVITQTVNACESVDNRHAIHVIPIEFSDNGVTLDLAWWSDARPLQLWQSRGEISQRVHQALAENNIEIPYPHRKLIGWPDGLSTNQHNDDNGRQEAAGSSTEPQSKTSVK